MLINKILKVIRKKKLESALKKYKNVLNIDASVILLDSTKTDFRTKRNQLSLEIGKDSMVGCNFIFESDQGFIKIGQRTFINGGTSVISRNKIEIGNDVTIGWGCYLYDHNSHSLNYQDRIVDIKTQRQDYFCGGDFITNKNWSTVKSAAIKIEDKVWIGFNTIILKGVTIGEGAIVGAGAVVTKDVLPYTVVAGNPAQVVKNIEH
jgi:Acetyltransferase (isoleucine patch superfamily)